MTGRTDPDRARLIAQVKGSFRWVEGHADVASVLRNGAVLGQIGAALAAPFASDNVTVVAGLEAKGFALASLVAAQIGCGMLLVRKEGALLPGHRTTERTDPDWRGRRLALTVLSDHVVPSDNVLLVDDWIQTAAQARAVFRLVRALGAHPVGVAALVDDLPEGDPLRDDLRVVGLVRSTDLGP